jgi:hypothetical protein
MTLSAVYPNTFLRQSLVWMARIASSQTSLRCTRLSAGIRPVPLLLLSPQSLAALRGPLECSCAVPAKRVNAELRPRYAYGSVIQLSMFVREFKAFYIHDCCHYRLPNRQSQAFSTMLDGIHEITY